MNLKLDADNPADREKLRRAVLDLVAGRKCQSKKALPSVVDCYFHHRGEFPKQRSLEDGFSGLIDLWENDRHRRTLPRGRLIACHMSRSVVLDVYLLDGAG